MHLFLVAWHLSLSVQPRTNFMLQTSSAMDEPISHHIWLNKCSSDYITHLSQVGWMLDGLTPQLKYAICSRLKAIASRLEAIAISSSHLQQPINPARATLVPGCNESSGKGGAHSKPEPQESTFGAPGRTNGATTLRTGSSIPSASAFDGWRWMSTCFGRPANDGPVTRLVTVRPVLASR